MPIDPGTALLIATAISSAASLGGQALSSQSQKKASKLRAKETKRETKANLLNDQIQGGAELEAQRLAGRSRLGKRKAQSYQDTADLLRGAFNI